MRSIDRSMRQSRLAGLAGRLFSRLVSHRLAFDNDIAADDGFSGDDENFDSDDDDGCNDDNI